jgi:ectoine hydroxylase-related dioxygenase (phytanoyl-CoA dioxygenase family)
MARFVADGYLLFEERVPEELNRAMLHDIDTMPHRELWRTSEAVRAVFDLPQIRAITESLVGPEPLYDHHAVHVVGPGHAEGQVWHGDAIIDTSLRFDIQYMYFPHDTPREMGGTMILPGSHFRRISCTDITRHHNFLGQKAMVCKAGSILVLHMGMWHCAQPNLTDRTRYMFKLRLNPSVRQLRLWNTEDIDDPSIGGILHTNHAWYGNEDRIEVVNRIRLWRYLTGNASYDTGYWMTRIENHPGEVAVAS